MDFRQYSWRVVVLANALAANQAFRTHLDGFHDAAVDTLCRLFTNQMDRGLFVHREDHPS